MEDIRHISNAKLLRFLEEIGEKKFRATQIEEWLWKKGAGSFDEMTNLSAPLRQKLSENFSFLNLAVPSLLCTRRPMTVFRKLKFSDSFCRSGADRLVISSKLVAPFFQSHSSIWVARNFFSPISSKKRTNFCGVICRISSIFGYFISFL